MLCPSYRILKINLLSQGEDLSVRIYIYIRNKICIQMKTLHDGLKANFLKFFITTHKHLITSKIHLKHFSKFDRTLRMKAAVNALHL